MTIEIHKKFTPEFRLEVAELVLEQGYSVKEAAQAMGVGESTVGKWVKRVRDERNGTCTRSTAITPDQRKIKELEKRIRQIETEKEILKKATALLMSGTL